ncbi:MAG: LysM peptidoglycan-binding domain-containing protein [Paludibacteraceae bacterium]|nr:LysM peptidoglycan-binding domain-containing protein [Paludibacteraceae bacterium]
MPSIKTHILTLLFIAFCTTAFAAPTFTDKTGKDSTQISFTATDITKFNLTDSVLSYGKMFINTPYRYGANGPESFDCSGYTSYVFKNFGANLHRTSYDQSTQFPLVDKSEIKPGDLVFFEGRRQNGRVGHVGIVTEKKENGEFDFIHASVNRGVIVTNSAEDYYTKRFVRASRVFENDSMLQIIPSDKINNGEYGSNSKTVKKVLPAKYHYVKKGETLSSIASKNGLTVAQLKRKNGLKKDILQIRQRLLIKDEQVVLMIQPTLANNNQKTDSLKDKSENKTKFETGAVCLSATKHTVERGETLYSISQKYGMTVAEIQKLNKTSRGKIYPGQTLVLSEEETEIVEQPTEKITVETNTDETKNMVVKNIKESPLTEKPAFNEPANETAQTKIVQEVQPGTAQSEIAKNETKLPKEKKEKTKNEKKTDSKKNEQTKTPIQIKEEVHIVRSGESLLTISRKYNTSIDELKLLNGLSGNVVEIGQMLVIHTNDPNYVPKPVAQHVEEVKPIEQKELVQQPVAKIDKNPKIEKSENEKTVEKPIEKEIKNEPALANIKPETHRVQRGESLYSIAKTYNMTINELKELNNMTNNALQAGQKLKVNAGTNRNVASSKTLAKKETTITHKVKSGENFSTIAKRYGCKVSDIKKWNNRTSDRLDVGDKLVIRKT